MAGGKDDDSAKSLLLNSARPSERVNTDFLLHRPVLPLHASIAPIKTLSMPSARERKKAFLSAKYYSECAFRGIGPLDADQAATTVKNEYGKWWPARSRNKRGSTTTAVTSHRLPKRLRISLPKRSGRNVSITSVPENTSSSAVLSSTDDESSQSHDRTSSLKQQQYLSEDMETESMAPVPNVDTLNAEKVQTAKAGILQELKDNGGDTTTPRFLQLLDVLHTYYNSQGYDARWTHSDPFCSMDGIWLNLSRPTYSDSLGRNHEGDWVYTLGRLAFDMFRPTGLRCSLQGIFQHTELEPTDGESNSDRPRIFPARLLQARDRDGAPPMRTNDLVISFTIEQNQTKRGDPPSSLSSSNSETAQDAEYVVQRPIQALLTNHGYCLPDPETPNRLSIWFCGGKLEPAIQDDDVSRDSVVDQDSGSSSCLEEWRNLFDTAQAPSRNFSEMARILAAKCFLGAHLPQGMEADGSLNYSLQRPIGGHGQVYVDVLYCDETMRIIQGHGGSVFVSIRPLASDGLEDDE
eukprot:CAMPEP_0172451832 /NCGR_PEP_ID=MMETSP1065-20121228/9696_1 /TAXON_ID=265537 /ORGANISM="Amphiprora paludosa, Strain CCMP125" /LENGTH=520 /DNA_ID=CAMNT_0013203803 /DNA_START=76 /DNA_END=1638 /DNA_ORIENTATION=+